MEKEKLPSYVSSDLIKLVCSLLGLAYFINLIKLDALGAYRKRAHWIPGNAFILSALTIQIRSYLDTTTVNFSDKPNFRELAMLLGNHLLIDSGRLIICVFMGYLLPGMARPGSGGDWGDISALAISLFTDITSELYFLHKTKDVFNAVNRVDYDYVYDILNESKKNPSIRTWYIVSSVGMLVSVIFLILFLGCTIVAGKTIRGILSQRIAVALSADQTEENTEEKVLIKSWIVARVCRPDYVIARSVLSSAAGMVVTLRIVLSLVKLRFLKYRNIIQYYDGLDELRHATFVLQCVFVFVGWIAICWRWITAVFYFPRRKNTARFFAVEDFWTRRIMELRFSWESRIALQKDQMLKARLANRVGLCAQLCFVTLAERSVTSFLKTLHSVVVFFSKVCWYLSEIVMGNDFIRWCFLRSSSLNYYNGDEKRSDDYSEFDNYREVLEKVRMPGESAGSLWVANQESIKQTKDHMDAGYQKGKDYRELIKLVSERSGNRTEVFESLPLVKTYVPRLDKSCWKMTAVSYVGVIVNLFPSSGLADKAKQAFIQAEDFMNFMDSAGTQENEMDFLDSLGVEADQVGKAADQEFKKLQKSAALNKNTTSVEGAFEEIRKLQQSAKQVLSRNGLIENGAGLQDSRDLREIASSYSMYRVCTQLLQSNNGEDVTELKDLEDKIEDHLGNVLAHCVLQVKLKLVKNCRKWARDFEDDKIWEVVYIAGKMKSVLENCPAINTQV